MNHHCPLIGPYWGHISSGGWTFGGMPLNSHEKLLRVIDDRSYELLVDGLIFMYYFHSYLGNIPILTNTSYLVATPN